MVAGRGGGLRSTICDSRETKYCQGNLLLLDAVITSTLLTG